MKFLLDTNIFLWYIGGDAKLPEEFKTIINDRSKEIYISIASLWEISIKASKGNIDLGMGFDEFIDQSVVKMGFKILQIEVPHLSYLRSLQFHHNDPFDRLIFSQSTVEAIPLIYTDKAFDLYTK